MHANENHYAVLTSPGRTSPQPGRLFAQHIWLARKNHLFQHWVIFVFLEGLNFRTHPYRHRLVGWHKNSPASVYRSGLLFGAYLWFLYPWATQELFDSKGHTGCILMWVEKFAVHTKLAHSCAIFLFYLGGEIKHRVVTPYRRGGFLWRWLGWRGLGERDCPCFC